MISKKDYADFVIEQIGNTSRVRAMFGAYTMYYNDKVIGMIDEHTVYLKVTDRSKAVVLNSCKTAPAYT